MTVIAYRDGVLAGDSRWTDKDLVIACQTKIVELDSGALYGGAGDLDDRELVALLMDAGIEAFEDLPDISHLTTGDEIHALVVCPNGDIAAIHIKEKGQSIYQVGGMPFVAIGSGRELALGAMAAGANAARAVEIACQFDTSCGPPVHALELRNWPGNQPVPALSRLSQFTTRVISDT